MNASDTKGLPIGVFDSGVGGLTVLEAIRAEMPGEDLVYLGDTARLPYGTKSPVSISRYACQATALLQQTAPCTASLPPAVWRASVGCWRLKVR